MISGESAGELVDPESAGELVIRINSESHDIKFNRVKARKISSAEFTWISVPSASSRMNRAPPVHREKRAAPLARHARCMVCSCKKVMGTRRASSAIMSVSSVGIRRGAPRRGLIIARTPEKRLKKTAGARTPEKNGGRADA